MEKKIMFWMDTKLEEVIDYINIWNVSIDLLTGEDIFENFFSSTLSKRFKSSKDSILLNYKLFFKTIGLINKNLNPTHILRIILKIKGKQSVKLSEIVLYLILIKGNYIQLLKDIDEVQNTQKFFIKGNKTEILNEIKELRKSFDLEVKDYRLDKTKILPLLETGGDEWFRILICELFKKGYYRSLSSLLEAISRRFANSYFHNSLKTNFLLKPDFFPPYGYKINWKFITNIINKYDKFFSKKPSILD